MVEDVTGQGGERILGRDAQRNNILAARVVAETVKSTLGPKGMDKMLVDRTGGITVTNDGVTILEEMDIEHPAANMIVEVAKTQEKEVGDGTTTAVMIAGKLLENAEDLLDKKIHPSIIARGYRWAEEQAQKILKAQAQEINTEEELQKIAQTAMTGKGADHLKEHFAELIVTAIKIIAARKEVTKEDIRIIKRKGASLQETQLVKGIVIGDGRTNKQMPQKITNAKIALIEETLENKKPETETRLNITDPEQFQQFIIQEEQLLKAKVERILESGANVVITQKGMDDMISYYLAKEGVYAMQRVFPEDIRAIAQATGATVVSRLNELTKEDLGTAGMVSEQEQGEETFTSFIENPHADMFTIIIRGGTTHVIDEIERAFEDAIGDVVSTLPNSLVVAGGGAIEMELAKQLRTFAGTLQGREQLAIEAYASALEFIPTTLAENAGLDPIDVITTLRAAHDKGEQFVGLNLFNEKTENTLTKGIIEPLSVKTQALSSASEVASMILRIDDVIAARKSSGNSAAHGLGALQGYD